MIKLRDLIKEEWLTHKGSNIWFPAHTKPTIDWISGGQHVALYPKQIESLFGKQPISSFHVTSPEHIKKLGKIIGKKKSISTFTRANYDSPLAKGRGIQTGTGGVIFYMKGTLLAKNYMDFETKPDKTGRRWVEAHYFTKDRMKFYNAMKKGGIVKKRQKFFDDIYDVKQKYEKQWLDGDIEYDEYHKAIEKESASIINKFIKDFFDWQNKYLERNKAAIKKFLRTPEDKPSAWWNEALIYDTKVIDAFVMTRITEKPEWGHTQKKEMLKYVPESKITIGTPAKFRKWYNAREGIIDQV